MTLEAILNKLVDQGVLGIILIAALWAIYVLYNHIVALQEKRVLEGAACQEAMRNNTQAIKDLTTAVSARRRV